MTTTNVILACDESGAKGKGDKREAYPGEVGVFAGFLVPQEVEAKARPVFQTIYNRYRPPTGKLHISELLPDQQHGLRQDVYAAIRESNLPCFWYAIHVEGFYDWYETEKKLMDNMRNALLEAQPQPRIKGGSPRDEPPSMHEQLFAGLYRHLVAFLEEQGQTQVSIEIRTDQIDRSIAKDFRKAAEQLLSDAPLSETRTGFDMVTKKLVKGRIEIEVRWPPSLTMDVVVARLVINPVGDGDGYVLAADVLANSLNHLFKNRKESERYNPLNEPTAIRCHPLAAQLTAIRDWGEGDLFADRLYQHPNGRQGGELATGHQR